MKCHTLSRPICTPFGLPVLPEVNMTLTRTDGKLGGFFVPTKGEKKDPIKITSVEENTNNKGEITLYFTAQDYDVNLLLTKVDEENVKGSLVGMFDVKAKRIKE